MPTGSTYGREKYPSSFKHLSHIGPLESELARFLYPLANRDVVYVFDDFIGGGNQEPGGTDWAESPWVGATSANGTAFAPPSTQLVNGICQGATGAYDQDTCAMYTQLVWSGDNRCGMEVKIKVDDIDNQQCEIGFTDSLTDSKEPVVNDIDTPTFHNGGADVALIARSVPQTLKTMAYVTDGTGAGMNATKTDLGTRNMTNGAYMTMRVQLDGDNSFCWLFDANDGLIESAVHDILAKQINGEVLLESRVIWESATTSAVVIDIDYWGIWQDRIA